MNNLPTAAGRRFKRNAGIRNPFIFRKIIPILPACASLLVSGMILFALPRAARAETQQGPAAPFILPGSEEVIVTASRAEEEVAFVPSNVTVLTDQDIRNSASLNIPELLSSASGITVTDLTGGKRNYRVDLRGFGETSGANTLVLVNGRRVNQPDLSGVDWTQIPLAQVKRIEIVRGGRGGVLFGDNASAGVINIITDGFDKNRGSVSLRGGSYSALALEGDYSGASDTLAYTFSGDIYNSDGYRDNSGTRGRNAGGSLDFSPNSRFRLNLSSGFHHDETGMPGALTETDLESGIPRSGTVYPDDRIRVNDYYFQARPRLLFLEESFFEADISFRKRDNVFYSSSYWGYFQGDTGLATLALSPRLVIAEQLGTMNNRLVAGIDLARSDEDILNTTSYSPQASFALERNNLGGYVYDEFFITEKLALSGGFRHDRLEYGFGPGLQDRPRFSENLSTAGISWQFRTGGNLFFEYGSGVRYPLLDEMFDFYSNSVNAGLEPQNSGSFQAGIKLFHPNTFFLNSAVYAIRTENELYFNPRGGPWGFGANENFTGTNRRKGLEIETGMQLGRLTLSGSYNLTDSEVTGGPYSGSEVPGVPNQGFAVKGIYFFNNEFDLTLEGTYTGGRHFESDWENAFPEQDDYFLLNSRLRFRVNRITLHLDLNNMLNQTFTQFGILGGYPTQRAYYPSPKFNARAGITFGF